jgi:hypothetical protein
VFVARGDVRRIACDWQLVTSGTDAAGVPGEVKPYWLKDERFARLWEASRQQGVVPDSCRRAVKLPRGDEGRGYVVVHTGETGLEPAAWFAEALLAAGELLVGDDAGAPANGRERSLVALPLLGTRHGGAGHRKAGVLAALLDAAAEVTERAGVDLVLVVDGPQAYSAAQRLRSDLTHEYWEARVPGMYETARTLAAHARERHLVPFIGSGVSASAGLPSWRPLLERLGGEAGLSSDECGELAGMDARDAGALLEKRLGARELDRALRESFAPGLALPSLSHCLIASLPIREAVTTNYDSLFEEAWRAATGEQPAVLPRTLEAGSARWLLKLHGDVNDESRSLVLSRQQYFELEHTGAAVAAVVQALLLTRHVLIVGYSLTDETFHRIAYDVRALSQASETSALAASSQPGVGGRFGTALIVGPGQLMHEVWDSTLALIPVLSTPEGGGDGDGLKCASRRQEIFLDLLALLAADAEAFLLGTGWQEMSQALPEQRLRSALLDIARLVESGQLSRPLERAALATLSRFGWTSAQARQRPL